MATGSKFECCLVGGTFDRFHAGHKLLLSVAISRCKSVEIYVVNDILASKKSNLIQSYEDRTEKILDWLSQKSHHGVKIFKLDDPFGPAPVHKTADAIVATPETTGNCDEINRMRKSSGLAELSILEVPHMIDYSGAIISSTRIRSGVIDADGNPWIEHDKTQQMLKMNSSLDLELKTPMGSLFPGPEDLPEVAMTEALESLSPNHGSIVAVGDVSVATMLDLEIIPDIGIIDGMTKRQELDDSEKVSTVQFQNHLHCNNPSGHLSPSMISSIKQALASNQKTLINVEGEEDLAPIIIHCLAPVGTVVIYGQPRVGVVVQITSLSVKERCRNILSLFEVIG
ncbi:MAG: pantetheine-phosphate adenylyltransferase [Candidatus Poseidoniaceae archaeon]|nr:pantetheine-phosphate adenylyltransferase [Candidatus Poseidoniaceae archaeon]MBL6896306.1 pantetheine-phosphate adenylyltransferase [Candidatus Poseidoniaceae archaeon]